MSKAIEDAPTDPAVRNARASALEQVAAVVRDDIRRGRYAPGARVVEAELQRTLGVSRGTVREALGRLAAEGLLDLHRFKGATVRALSPDDMQAILEMREVLEGLVARRAALRIGDDGAGRELLLAAQAELERAMESGTPDDAYIQANTRYHEALVRIADSRQLAAQIDMLFTAFLRASTVHWLSRANFAASNEDHRAITAAILEGDAASAEMLMRSHIRRTAIKLRQLAAHHEAA